MAPSSKADKKAALDAASWMFNVVTSVGIIIVNKALMATYGFSFGKNFIFSPQMCIHFFYMCIYNIVLFSLSVMKFEAGNFFCLFCLHMIYLLPFF